MRSASSSGVRFRFFAASIRAFPAAAFTCLNLNFREMLSTISKASGSGLRARA